ncbi:MAG: hypothetical protein JO358_01455 [Alphaproteobacteria bacterium]|nr:hypothetical protein [Alphaproteobacteria bacterium]
MAIIGVMPTPPETKTTGRSLPGASEFAAWHHCFDAQARFLVGAQSG